MTVPTSDPIERVRRAIIEREKNRAPQKAINDLELQKVMLCMWTDPDQFEILPEGEEPPAE